MGKQAREIADQQKTGITQGLSGIQSQVADEQLLLNDLDCLSRFEICIQLSEEFWDQRS